MNRSPNVGMSKVEFYRYFLSSVLFKVFVSNLEKDIF